MKKQLRLVAAYFALWLPFIALYCGIFYLQKDGRSLWGMTVGATSTLIPPMLAGLGVWWLSGRVPVPQRGVWKFALLHLTLTVLFAATWSVWVGWEMLSIPGDRGGQYFWQYVLPWQSLIGLFVYGLMTAVSYAVRGATRSRDLVVAAERADKLRAQAELAALRAHINPHFLFNALHAVTQLLRTDPSRAEEALERLSDLFRYVLRLDRERADVVSLDDEWRFTQSYLWLEQMRMGGRLRVDAEFDDEALVLAVPPFTLQPLIENAVRHGLSPKREGGSVRVRGTSDGSTITIRVTDDGVGADPKSALCSAGVGVRAVRQRIEARHGSAFRADIVTRAGEGFDVTLVFPAESMS